jgi:CRP/FNR family cyclic AMP-dependent transcriptional regulator
VLELSPVPSAKTESSAGETRPQSSLLRVTPGQRTTAADFWRPIRDQLRGRAVQKDSDADFGSSPMEPGMQVITRLAQAPPRTLHLRALTRSSPIATPVRAMLEAREFGRRYDSFKPDLQCIVADLPELACPSGAVEFRCDDTSFEDLSLSVDCLLQHRKALLAPSIDRSHPRKRVLILGGGPGGLMSAVQMALRDHQVVLCEQREAYSRNRYIGVYREVAHLMAALGLPERMTYDFSQYRGKRGIMLADIQTFLHAVALKLGVVIYTGAAVRSLSAATLQEGQIDLVRASVGSASAPAHSSVGMMRWHYDTIARVRSGVPISFDMIVEATGGRSGLREVLVGADNVVPLGTLASAAARRDPSLKSYFEDPNDHCAEYVESGYGCPPGLRKSFSEVLLEGNAAQIPQEIPCFVSNIDASIFTKPMDSSANPLGLASHIDDRELKIPHDWVVLECRLADQSLARYHIEGPLPQTFEFGGTRLSTRDALAKINPVSLLFRFLYAIGVPFEDVDRRRLVDFYTVESSRGDPGDVVATFVGTFRGVRLGGERPRWTGPVPGSDTIEYGIVGEALQNAWYRFGVGVDDTFAAATRLAECIELPPDARLAAARLFEQVMTSRSVQILYHLYGVSLNVEEGVIASVLTEYHLDEQRAADVAVNQLRDVASECSELFAAKADLQLAAGDSLLEAALDYQHDILCRHALALLEARGCKPGLLAHAIEQINSGHPERRSEAFGVVESALSPRDRALLSPLFADYEPPTPRPSSDDVGLRIERLVELGLGQYAWASAWVRACALETLASSTPGAAATLTQAVADPNPLVAETAAAALLSLNQRAGGAETAAGSSTPYSTIDRVKILKKVSLFRAIPDEVLAGVAALLSERWVAAEAQIVGKGESGDCLYIIASGRVRVHDAARTLAYIDPPGFVGELSLLDGEPRSASVSTCELTHLFSLKRSDFHALISQRPEITSAINRALCALIRAADTKI